MLTNSNSKEYIYIIKIKKKVKDFSSVYKKEPINTRLVEMVGQFLNVHLVFDKNSDKRKAMICFVNG